MSATLRERLDPASYLPEIPQIDVSPDAYRLAESVLREARERTGYQHYGRSSLAGSAAPGATTLDPALLGAAVGLYVLALAAILTVVATGLDRGLDRTLVGYRVGLALLSATVAYLAAFLGASMFF